MTTRNNIILASGSAARKMMLENAGIVFDTHPANIDERSLAIDISDPTEMALRLAQEKAISVSQDNPASLVIGSDQVLTKDSVIYHKAKDKAEAFERLKEFSGQTHSLISAVAVAMNGNIVWNDKDQANLTMKPLSDDRIQSYIEAAGDVVTQCIGCYALEGIGIRLFSQIEGNYFTILGMPFLSLLNYLDDEGYLS